jgi:TM2 domain-containing membrane protein YozV
MYVRFIVVWLLLCTGAGIAQESEFNLSYNSINLVEPSFIEVNKNIPYNKFEFGQQSDISEKKSVGKALLFSLILPGAGEFYVGNESAGKLFLGIEILAWGTLLVNNNYYNSLKNDYKTYSSQHAGVIRSGKNNQYWIDIGKYNNTYAYNEQRVKERRIEQLYDESGPDYWKWDSQKNRYTYDRKRLAAVNIKDRDVYFFAGILVNHLVSAINAVRLARQHNRNLANNGFNYRLVVNTLNPENKYLGISLSKAF